MTNASASGHASPTGPSRRTSRPSRTSHALAHCTPLARLIALVALVALVTLSALSSGCLSRPPLQKQLFALSLPNPTPAAKPALDDVVELRRVTIAPQFAERPLVYRLSDSAWEIDPYAEFIVPPERLIATSARQWLREAKVFRDVIEPTSLIPANRLAELHVTAFHGDFRDPKSPAAVLTVRAVIHGPLRTASPAAPGAAGAAGTKSNPAEGCAKDYSRRIALTSRTAEAVVQGLQKALGECLAELARDLQPTAGH